MNEIMDLLSTLASWPTFAAALVVYGFAPGFLLRLFLLGYKKNDPRRDELISTLYELPRYKRPFWVLEQLETVLFDGVAPRIKWALTGRLILRWSLASGVKLNKKHPDTFHIPNEKAKADVEPSVVVKLGFIQSDGWGERMWVKIEHVGRRRLTGHLLNTPLDFPRLHAGDRIKFRPEHIIDIDWEDHPDPDPELAPHGMCDHCFEERKETLLRQDTRKH